MKKNLIPIVAAFLLIACNQTNESTKKDHEATPAPEPMIASLGINGCEQVDFSSIPAANLNVFIDFDTVFNNYSNESLLIHIPDSTAIVNGDNLMKILLQSANYSNINSIEKSKVFKDGESCHYNYIVLNLKMNSNQPTTYPVEYQMSVPITAAEWSTTDFVLLQLDDENKKIVGTHTEHEPQEKSPVHN